MSHGTRNIKTLWENTIKHTTEIVKIIDEELTK
jgi:hypothetical protein